MTLNINPPEEPAATTPEAIAANEEAFEAVSMASSARRIVFVPESLVEAEEGDDDVWEYKYDDTLPPVYIKGPIEDVDKIRVVTYYDSSKSFEDTLRERLQFERVLEETLGKPVD